MTPTVHPAPAGASDATDADFVSTIHFKSPVDRVFAALTDPARLSSWWVKASGSGLQGGELTFLFPVEKLVVRVDRANRSIVQWSPLVCEPLPDWVGTTITFTLSETRNGGSQLDFRHAGLAQLACFEMCREGWEYYLPSLVDYVDTGTGRPGSRKR
jgi:uncharacterized protein YndB with AHSA1/START domain